MKHSVLKSIFAGIIVITQLPAVSQACFSSQTYSSSTESPYKIISADFNNDGLADLACTNYYGRSLDVRLNSNGTFPSKITFTMVEAPLFVVSNDFNKDGFMDLAFNVTMANLTDYIQLYYGDGTGQFTDAGRISVEIYQPALATGDFNGDSYPDLVANSNGYLYFFFNTTKGGFYSWSYSIPGVTQCASIRCVDLNHDGKDDIITSEFNADLVSVYFATGLSVPVLVDTLKTRDFPLDALTMDVTGDGVLDLIVGHGFGVSLYSGNGQGQFTFQNDVIVGNINGLGSADLTGDGKAEILCISYNQNRLSFLNPLSAGVYSVSPDKFTTGKNPYSFVTADFNNDGRVDAATANINSDNISVFLNTSMSIKGPKTICSGSKAILVASSADNYKWEPSSLTTPVININPAQTATYAVTGAVGNCTTTAVVTVKVDACLSLNEKDTESAFRVFPSPGTGRITIQSEASTSCDIYNCLGAHLMHQSLLQSKTELDLGHLPEGLYFISLSSGEKKVFVIKR